ncbi:MAG TPA: NAD-dependent epimerase/dehydratase family protein [Blastocatellia bacterium]|jgi:UDP-glucuronate 4-epimerase|nr:NAD-dependent epimerase/dehydratase family protein [Blastocatellia bacterium]
MTNILVTGGAGFIGSHLVDRLMNGGNEILPGAARVTVVDNFNDFYSPAIKRANIAHHAGRDGFELIEADIADALAMNELFARGRFDCVVHLAARAGVRPSLEDPLAYEETNVRGTYALLEAARRHGVRRFVFGSSSSVYGINSRLPFSEDDPIARPISPYAATKVAGEAACHVYSHLYGMRVVCLRFFTVYGARQRPDLAIHKFARLISEGRPIPVFGDGTTRRDYTYIDDIISGVGAAMRFDRSGFEVINLGESQTVELRSLIALLERSLGRRAVIDRQPQQPGDVPITYASIDKARRLLGYDPGTKIEAGIEKFVAWFKGQEGTRREKG